MGETEKPKKTIRVRVLTRKWSRRNPGPFFGRQVVEVPLDAETAKAFDEALIAEVKDGADSLGG